MVKRSGLLKVVARRAAIARVRNGYGSRNVVRYLGMRNGLC